MTTWTPHHPATKTAWEAVVENLTERAQADLWGSRSIAVSIARTAGLSPARADDLIRSAIKHDYLEERPAPPGTDHHRRRHPTQVRLAGAR